jgi:hypothetical protein
MSEIRLSDCEIVVISLATQDDRYRSVSATLEAAGLPHRLVRGIECKPGFIGCGLSHIKALRTWNTERPLLVLEDDIALTDDFRPSIERPADADAIYLGASAYGTVADANLLPVFQAVIAEDAASGLVRVHNMLAAHAILHLTDRWKQGAIEGIMHAMIDRGLTPDQGLANIQGDFRVYAAQQPFFYQCAELQRPELAESQVQATLVKIPVLAVGTVARVSAPDRHIRLMIVADGDKLAWRYTPAQPNAT